MYPRCHRAALQQASAAGTLVITLLSVPRSLHAPCQASRLAPGLWSVRNERSLAAARMSRTRPASLAASRVLSSARTITES